MSQEITTAFVQQYSSNVFHLSQQKGSRLKPCVRNEMQVGKSAFYDRIGSVTATKLVGRHQSTPQIDTPHSRRRVTLNDYAHADLIDDMDKIRMLIDPQSEYVMAFAWALGRAMDDEIIAAMGGNAYGGEDGTTTVALTSTQKFVCQNGSSAGTNLTVDSLRAVKKIFDANDVDESIPRYFGITSSQLASLLGQTAVTSADYNSVKALVQGQINSFMGFNFVRLERFGTQSSSLTYSYTDGSVGSGSGDANGYRKCYAWAQNGMLLATGKDITGKITERDDKNYAKQVYASMSVGATRMEEVKVVEVYAKE